MKLEIVKVLVVYICTVSCIYGQDLIYRTQKQLAPKGVGTPSLIADQIYLKKDLSIIKPFKINKKGNNQQKGINSVTLSVDESAVKSLYKKQEYQIQIPVDERHNVSLKIYPVEILAPNYYLEDSEGNQYNGGKTAFYRGVVADDPSSLASVVVLDGTLRILISDKEGNYNIGRKKDNDSYVFYNDADLGPVPFHCENESSDYVYPEEKQYEIKQENNKAGECVRVYVEIDNASYSNLGGMSAAENFVIGAFAEVAILYDNINVPIQVSKVKVWTTDDPYGAESNVGTALNYLVNNVNSFDGDLFHLISAKNGNSFSGVGYLSCRGAGPCKATTIGTNVPFAVSQTTTNYAQYPNYSWTVAVLAHEMGHTMGAPHTHACVWGANNNTAIDGCVTPSGCADPGPPPNGDKGTLMSYCHLTGVGTSFSNGFGSEVGTHIYNEYLYAQPLYLSACGAGAEITGCLDPDDHNYNPQATVADGSCQGTCTDNIQNGDEEDIDCGGSKCAPCSINCDDNYIQLTITFDQYASETSWNIKDQSGQIIHFGDNYSNQAEGSVINVEMCLPDGTYTFSITDSYGDGMCCSYGDGSYRIIDGNADVRAQGGSFGAIEETVLTFNVATTSCNDGIQNGGETDVDCGGASCVPCNACEHSDLVISSSQNLSGYQKEIASNTISTTAEVIFNDGASVLWQAGNSININSTFEVKTGAEIVLSTDDCDN